MIASGLSFEILFSVASLLTTKDKLCCTLVCSSWKAPFQDALWSTVDISGYEKLDAMCNLILQPNVYLQNGHRVRKLLFNKGVATSESQLLKIQQYFCNIEYLKIRLGNLTQYKTAVVSADWSLWRTLTHLDIYVSGLNSENEPRDVLHIVSFLPALRRFDLTDKYYTLRLPYTLQDFENFHAYLPRLEYLAMDFLTKKISFEEVLQANIIPTTVLTTVNLFNRRMDHGWLYYCALKYPNVHTFGWRADCRQDATEQEQEQAMSMISSFTSFFPHLHTLFFRELLTIDLRHTILWKLLCQAGVYPKHLHYDLEWMDSSPYQSRRTLSNGMYSCSEHLETLSLTSFNHNFLLTHSLLTLGEFPRLVDLRIMLNRASIFFDVILDQCISLKSLKLDNCLVIFDSATPENSAKHGLRQIEICHLKVGPKIFHYISVRCQELDHLSLNEMRIVGSMSKDSGALYLNMPYTCLKLLKLNNVYFYSSDNEYDKDLIKIFCIEQSDSSVTNALKNIKTFERYPICVLAGLWFYYCLNRSEGNLAAKIRILNPDEIDFAQKYFKSFRNKMIGSPINLFGTSREFHSIEERTWKDDLVKGHVRFFCKYMSELSIDNVPFCKNTT
ncbi:hypothetical protein J3Q64DRAFT_1830459 [Phycomyces blakesleeanus]|uniref:F-box domain-containing protein n=2 Tax=Phycomyces blakesleeanus TaxID=4837 RepID=A0A162UKC1_PHYB8|nr:hypothetical protein PHYBLDRAFT_165299 [Phycomyces blakesleeanus NRRL 1555(-)]OAD76792.1 hypothetical protein PHYBLDRAFT_165299 [Phycomyces blakesleeanus NRRL 1555(-)]|eukprot:XP_018294832.1 hypothetical protein PHYBLDRAFT_165299 [Phycomyces blakesleeanus NRRL 1555(-)]